MRQLLDVLDRCVSQQVPIPQNGHRLQVALLEEWDNTSQATIDNLVMSTCCQCITLCEVLIAVCELGPSTPLCSCCHYSSTFVLKLMLMHQSKL